MQEQLDTCRGMADGTTCATEVTGPGVCDASVCLRQRCGDGYRATEELCDGTEFATIVDCTSFGFYNPDGLSCNASCEPDPSQCTGYCGDTLVEGPEVCDGAPPIGQDCITYGFGTGALECTGTCTPDFAGCIEFGWTSISMPRTVRAIGGTADTNIWVGGDDGLVRRFDGTAWIDVDVSACAFGDITAVSPVSTTDAYVLDDAITGDGVIRITATGCSRSTISSRIHAIWAVSPTSVYASEDDSFTGTWHFDGTTWTQVNGVRARFIWGSSATDFYTGSIFRPDLQHFSNGTWSSVTVPDASAVWGIWGNSADDFYVAATDSSDRALVKRFRTGTGWTTELSNLALLGTTSLVGGGSSYGERTSLIATSTSQQPYVLSSSGDGWANLGANLSEPPAGTTYTTPSGVLYVAPAGQARILRFSGTASLPTSTLLPAGKVHALDAGTALATVNIGVTGQLSTMFWDGLQWRAEPSAANNVGDVLVLPTGEVFVVSTNAGVRRRDGFDTYTPVGSMFGPRIGGSSVSDLWVITGSAIGELTHWTGSSADVYTNVVTNADFVLALTPTLAFAISASGAMARWTGVTWSATTSPLTTRALGVTRTSDTEGWVWHATQIAHFENGTWTTVAPPPNEPSIRGVWGTTNDLFVAGSSGLHYFDGVQWMRVDTGDAFDLRSLDGRDGSIYFSTFNTVRQLYRTDPW